MKYLICQDIHLKGINSENRIGNYYSDVITKIKEIISIAKEKEVSSILCGGDIFDIPVVSNLIVDELVDLIEYSEIHWQVVPGNHDEIGHSWNNSKGTSLAHIFRRSDMINKFEWEQRVDIDIIDKEKDMKTYIQGFEYYHDIEQDLKNYGLYINDNAPNKSYKIALVHALIVEKKLPTEMCITIDEVKTDFDVVFIAHNHKQFDITKNGTRFIDLGCIGRRKTDESDINPRVAILDTDTKEIEIIYLKNVKKGSEVFDLEEVAKNKEYENEVNNFVTSLKEEKFEELDLLGIIEKLAKESKLENEIKNEVIRRIE